MKLGIIRDPSSGRYCIHDGTYIIEEFERSELAKAEKRKEELEAQASGEAESEATKPARRQRKRRWKKLEPWMIEVAMRSKEENWRLGDTESYQAAADTIAKIKTGAPALKAKYGFRDYYPIEEFGFDTRPFDLADHLIGLLETYQRNRATLPELKERINEGERRMAEIRKTGTLANARSEEIFALVIAGYKLHDPGTHRLRGPVTNGEKHALQKAVRQAIQAPRKEGGAGRYLTAKAMLARGLASTYYLGTGKWPVTGTRGQFRGPYARFAHECLALLNIEVTDATLRDQAGEMRADRTRREQERSRRAQNEGVKPKRKSSKLLR